VVIHGLLIESVDLCRVGGSAADADFLGNNFDSVA
jgi:hypothetical protein